VGEEPEDTIGLSGSRGKQRGGGRFGGRGGGRGGGGPRQQGRPTSAAPGGQQPGGRKRGGGGPKQFVKVRSNKR
jgi:hypothetical protein